MYDDAKLKIDEIAERILTLRFQPVSNFSEYLKRSNLSESPSDTKDVDMVKALLEDHGKILIQMRKVIDKATDAGDEGTIDLIGSYIGNVEKISWMLDAWTKKTGETHPEA
jgi:starvation-inducible DNA-binding protein